MPEFSNETYCYLKFCVTTLGSLTPEGSANFVCDLCLRSIDMSENQSLSPSSNSPSIAPEREQELLALIHDLNQCNDVLLSRVTQLESALEQSQSAQQLSQQVSHNAPQQIAKLVSELDNTEQALNRQQLVNENLQTELDNAQERIAQLERECTIVAQQHLEEVQAKAKAESTSKDLRSRLQRQQRYTMQFKAALEKSLTVTAKPANTTVAQPVSFKDSTAVAMPRAQRIMPWVSDNSSPFAGIDPHLESLIRGVGKSSARSGHQPAEETTGNDSGKAEKQTEQTTTPEAEAKLWQDLERVISHAEETTDAAQEQPIAAQEMESSRVEDPVDLPAAPVEIPAEPVSSKASGSEKADLIRQIENSFAAANHSASEETVSFTEPSPWHSPQPESKPEQVEATSVSQAPSPAEESYLPAIDSQMSSTVAPLVKPLRSQKKPVSLSNIELPTFQNAKMASFRR